MRSSRHLSGQSAVRIRPLLAPRARAEQPWMTRSRTGDRVSKGLVVMGFKILTEVDCVAPLGLADGGDTSAIAALILCI